MPLDPKDEFLADFIKACEEEPNAASAETALLKWPSAK